MQALGGQRSKIGCLFFDCFPPFNLFLLKQDLTLSLEFIDVLASPIYFSVLTSPGLGLHICMLCLALESRCWATPVLMLAHKHFIVGDTAPALKNRFVNGPSPSLESDCDPDVLKQVYNLTNTASNIILLPGSIYWHVALRLPNFTSTDENY